MHLEQREIALSTGRRATVVVAICRRFDVAPLAAEPARLTADLTMLLPDVFDVVTQPVPVPPPSQRCPPHTIGDLEIWAERARVAATLADRPHDPDFDHRRMDRVSASPSNSVPVTQLGYPRDAARGRAQATLLTNSNLFLMGEEVSPLDAFGDPIGFIAADGEILSPPVGGRGAVVQLPDRVVFTTLCLSDVEITLPTGETVRSDPRNHDASEAVALSHHELAGGITPALDGIYEVAIVQRWAVAAKRGGGLPVPGGGFVLRWGVEPRPEIIGALRDGAPVAFRSRAFPKLVAGLQAGPVLCADSAVVLSDSAFRDEGFVGSPPLRYPPIRFRDDAYVTRAARLAVGTDASGQVIVVGVAGESSKHATTRPGGVTLGELAEIMQGLGAVDALNLDGGGSTQMFAGGGGQLLRPGDRRGIALAAYDRPVPTALMFS